MKKLTLLLIASFFISTISAQQKALTEKGEEVILFDDGTWKYQNNALDTSEIFSNPKEITKDENATFLLKSSKFNVGFWLNPKVWTFKKATNNQEAEYEFKLKDGDLYGMVLAEQAEIPLETLRSIALENGKAFAPDLTIVKQEYRKVNGLKVLLLQMNGTAQGIKFSYLGYYFSTTNGTVQFITYTTSNLIDEYRNRCESLLNGLVLIN